LFASVALGAFKALLFILSFPSVHYSISLFVRVPHSDTWTRCERVNVAIKSKSKLKPKAQSFKTSNSWRLLAFVFGLCTQLDPFS